MFTEKKEAPVATAEAVKLIEVVMAEDPIELKEIGIETVYKNPRTNVLSVSEIVVIDQNSRFLDSFSNEASKGYLVTLSVPEDCYDAVLTALNEEPFITKVNGIKTDSGKKLENSLSEMIASAQDEASEEHNSCSIM